MNTEFSIEQQAIDRESSIPLYKQIFFILKKEIESSSSRFKGRYYSEKELMNIFGVSRITVRSTLRMLEDGGYISRTQGSSAVVVDQKKYTWNLYNLTGDLRQLKDSLTTQVQSIEKFTPTEEIKEKLKLKVDTDFVYKIERLRIVEETVMARSISYLIPSLDLDKMHEKSKEDLSITTLLIENGENPLYAEETLEAVNGDEKTCSLLNLPNNYAVFLRKRITFDHLDKPLEYVISYYNSQHTQYYIKNKLL